MKTHGSTDTAGEQTASAADDFRADKDQPLAQSVTEQENPFVLREFIQTPNSVVREPLERAIFRDVWTRRCGNP